MVEVIYGNVPSKSNCYKVTTIGGKARMYKAKALKEYEKSFMYQIGLHKGQNIATHFKLSLDVFYPSRRADLDNSLKIVLDALQMAQAVKNDRDCVEIHARRFVDKENPRIEFELTPLENERDSI